MSRMSSDIGSEFEAVKSDLNSLKNDLRSLAGTVMKQGASTAHDAKDAVQSKVESSVESMEDFVRERPMTTVLLAFGAGLLAGLVLKRN